MKGKSIYKVPGGKLVKISLEYEGDLIKDITITGDFFLYPEEEIASLEERLKNCKIKDIPNKINKIIAERKIKFFGINEEALIKSIMLAATSKDNFP